MSESATYTVKRPVDGWSKKILEETKDRYLKAADEALEELERTFGRRKPLEFASWRAVDRELEDLSLEVDRVRDRIARGKGPKAELEATLDDLLRTTDEAEADWHRKLTALGDGATEIHLRKIREKYDSLVNDYPDTFQRSAPER